ncbi:adenosylcobinamide-GDP ribazoletransferase [Vibrio sp. DW001]|uniref:adenosylcobinamide-GDP ribazoletransferase n=1 Tax=Vibrio sp. DW001 TaxID=2912315 RepID=UPI0023AFB61A|nr:adenosylcobinamide-GDP ribazoletransferase [Vibrio sp. DW001]WED28728.1 adenosylcobinamide-GDP ribazoletransferase [Vibrio sp. DW001]
MLKREWQVLLLGISIFTRLPIPVSIPYSETRKNESYKYCGLVGLIIGGLTALVYSAGLLLWSTEVSVVISMVFSVFITGAFHEDGFADTCDGFGGGITAERKLEIMKDSRIGAYALLATVLIILLKYSTLLSLHNVPVALVLAHILSRSMAVSFIYTHGYVRQADQSKLKVAKSRNSRGDFITMMAIGVSTCLLIQDVRTAVLMITMLFIVRLFFSRWMMKQIGGYTGDVLGAVQQVTEVLCYLILLATVSLN